MNKYILISLFLIFISCHTSKNKIVKKEQSTLINFVKSDNLVNVLKQSKQTGKPVFLYLHTSWCTPCRFMEEEVFSFPSSAKHMNDNFINYEVDMEVDNGPDLAFIFNAKTIPTLLILNSKGAEISRNTGALGNTKLLNWTNEILSNL